MSKTPDPTKIVRRRKDARPAEILDAAALVFAKHGYAATNLEQVAALANVSKGTIYRYFEDKDVLFAQVIEAKLFDQLEAPPPMNFPRSATVGTTLRQALWLAYEQGRQGHLADLVRVLLLEGERFAALRKRCIARLIALATSSIQTILTQFDKDANLRSSAYFANPALVYFPIICAISLHNELDGVEGFDMDGFVTGQLDLLSAALDQL